jgi:predicted transcriptional regulator
MEGGELDYVVEETWRMKPEELEKMLNPRRLELLEMISGSHIESINDVARKVGRNVRNVYDDLKLLEKKGFLHFRKVGKKKMVPETRIEEVSVIIH